MKKNFEILMACLVLMAGIYSCKKEPKDRLPAIGVFASVEFADPFEIFTNPTTGTTLKILYHGEPTGNNGGTVLTGEGKFEFFNTATGTKVLDTILNITAGPKKTYYMYKPDPEKEEIKFMENTQSSEPPAAEDHVKVKVANFAQALLGDENIKIVFNQLDDAVGDYVPVDTIQTTGSNYTSGHIEIPRTFTIRRGRKVITTYYMLTFLDQNDQKLPGYSDWESILDKSVYTLFLLSRTDGGFSTTTLFVN